MIWGTYGVHRRSIMAKINFTAGRIRDFQCPSDKQQAFLWDSATQGLGIRATSGSKSFIFQGKLNREVIRIKIGSIDAFGIDGAREQARSLKKILDSGRDPRVVIQETIASDLAKRKIYETNKTPALDAWIEYIKDRTPKWSDRHKADHESMSRTGGEPISRGKREGMAGIKVQGILRPLLMLPLSQISRDTVRLWLDAETVKRPTRARLALSALGTFLTWCSDRSEYKHQVNPDVCKRLKKDLPKPKAKNDCLQREQLAAWFENVRKIPNPIHSAYLQCLLITGARRQEMAKLRWENVDFKWKTIVIGDKVEGQRTIPLTPYISLLLNELYRLNNTPPNILNIDRSPISNWKPSKWVFSSATSKTGHIQEPRLQHNKAIIAAGLPHLSLHGLRRSFNSLSEWVECPTGISAQISGHKPSAIVEKHYKRRSIDLLRMWHIKLEEWTLEQAGIKHPDVDSTKLKIAI